MTINPKILDFISKQCKCGLHQNCYGKWEGLGFEVVCDCNCGHNKSDQALVEVEGPLANAIDRTDAVITSRTGDHNGDN